MQESYKEDDAHHFGPESCLDDPRGRGEALTGEYTGHGNKEKVNRPMRIFSFVVIFALGSLLTSGFFLCQDQLSMAVSQTPLDASLTLNDLLMMPQGDLKKVDIAKINLICAQGLNGSESLNINRCLATLDQWADICRKDIEARLLTFPQYATKYDNSINLFKIVNMVLTLKNTIGVDYNPEIMKRNTYPDSGDVFIHGCLDGNKQGGCISIPVLCVSVGRRLGYPLKLVLTREHVFFRWDDGNEVFNIEACCPGCDSFSDDYYKTWPNKISNKEIRQNHFLKSLTPAEELSLFLETRGHCLFDAGKTAEAQIMYAHAYKRMPTMVKLSYFDRVIRIEYKKMKD
ncbi:hypothetical protein J7M07_09445 [bacterium]|nr:hypothetical protein [bacterium]